MGKLTTLCIFCCRPTSTEQNVSKNNLEILEKFLKNISRLLQCHLNCGIITEYFYPYIKCCSHCLEIVESVSSLFHQTKCLELRLEWKIATLVKLMKAGGKVPSRQKDLKRICEGIDGQNLTNNQVVSNSYRRLSRFRRQLIKKCSKHKSPFPALFLPKQNKSSNYGGKISDKLDVVHISTNASPKQPRNEQRHETRENFPLLDDDMLSTIAFILVVFMCNFGVGIDQSCKKSNLLGCEVEDVFSGIEDSNNVTSERNFANSLKEFASTDETVEALGFVDIPIIFDDSVPLDSETVSFTLDEFHEQKLAVMPSSAKIVFDTGFQSHDHEHEVAVRDLSKNAELNKAHVQNDLQMRPLSLVDDENGEINGDNRNLNNSENERVGIRTLRTIMRCKICSQTFTSSMNYSKHLKSHDGNSDSDESEGKYSEDENEYKVDQPGISDVNSDRNSDGSYNDKVEIAERIDKLKQEPLPCEFEGCLERFTLPEELENHSKHHGEFSCSECQACFTFAPDLVIHEAETHCSELKVESESKSKSKSTAFKCLRCDLTINRNSKWWMATYTKHVLESHMNLPWKTNICEICHKGRFSRGGTQRNRSRRDHFKLCHDISGMDPKNIQRCDFGENCKAYFRLASQLTEHKNLIHKAETIGSYVCNECPERKEFKSKKRLHNHRFNHHANNHPFQCSEENCFGRFPTEQGLRMHKIRCHGPSKICFEKHGKFKRFRCGVCLKMFKGKDRLLVHQTKHHNNDQIAKDTIICGKEGCDERFTLPEEFENHSKFHGTFNCTLCPTVINFAPEMAIHEVENHCVQLGPTFSVPNRIETSKTFQCVRCEFTVKRTLRWKATKHFLEKHLELSWKTFICEICHKGGFPQECGFKGRKDTRRSHFSTHHNVSKTDPTKIHKCDVANCSAYFRFALQLSFHKRHVHAKQLKCEICKKELKTLETFRNRMQNLHKANLNIACTVDGCGSKFLSQVDLAYHQARAHSQRSIKCKICNEQFTNDRVFRKHAWTHKKITPKEYICEICGKVSKDVNRHRLHNLAHSGPDSWEYCCDTCGKKCISKESLAQHKRVHTGEKLFQCQVCGAKYAHRHNLRIHVNNKHGDIMEDKAQTYTKNFPPRKGIRRGAQQLK